MSSDQYLISKAQQNQAAREESKREYLQDLELQKKNLYDLQAEAFYTEYQTIKAFKGNFYTLKYSPNPGIYEVTSEEAVESYIWDFATKSNCLSPNTATLKELKKAIKCKYLTELSPSNYLAFKNGKYNKSTCLLEPYTENDFYIDAFDYDYKPGNWALIDQFLNQLTATPELPSGDQDFKAALIAFCYKTIFQEKSWEYFLYLYGEGATGKTTFILFLESLATTYSETSLKELNATFGLENIWGKVLAVMPDESKCAEDMSRLKTLTSQSHIINVNRKNLPSTDLPFTGSVVMASNLPVFIGNFDGGVERRALIVPCLNEVAAVDRDYDLKDKLKAELSGFTHWLLSQNKAEQRAALNNHANHLRVKALTQSFKDEADSVSDFATNRLELKEGNLIESKVLYQNYCVFCQENGRKPKNQVYFGRGLQQIYRAHKVAKTRAKGAHVWKGLVIYAG